jgi:cell shape-determining protein MreD
MDLAFGIRYAIGAALWGGILKDAFGVHDAGVHVMVYLIVAYLTLLFRKTIYTRGSVGSRYILVSFVALACVLIHLLLQLVPLSEKWIYALSPAIWTQMLITIICSNTVFEVLKKCGSI